ncbi:hypothetical protein KSP40_PGU007814 [Platanthera guangdongensis]|uniref:Uncharacterized protein n=1 Tax=Platanthera guangdongensis TaxID=2320717 RepID=A0ABR2LW10_9ASPA
MMASACVNNVGIPQESFPPAYAWLSPNVPHYPTIDSAVEPAATTGSAAEVPRRSVDRVDFEFRLDEVRVTMLAADELFSEGKLVPLHVTALQAPADPFPGDLLSSEADAKPWICAEGIGSDSFVLSPKAPRCSARWRELLGLKRLQNPKKEPSKTASSPLPSASPRAIEPTTGSKTPTGKSFKNLLQRHLKTSIDPLLSLPLLRDGGPDAVSSSLSSRLSLSSSSSGPEHEDLPRLSLDSEKPRNPPRLRISRPLSEANFPTRVARHRGRQPPDSQSAQAWGVSVDSPRMDPSGRVIFEGLERSSSSPSSFNGVPTTKYRGMQRSYSANVRIPSVLNVPVCSIRRSSKSVSVFGFGQLFSQPRKDRNASSASLSSTMGRPANASAAAGKTTIDSARKRDRLRARREPRGF